MTNLSPPELPAAMTSGAPKVLFAQTGSREFYAPAAAAHEHGQLARLITDLWVPFATPAAVLRSQAVPSSLKRLLTSRRTTRLPSGSVVSFPGLGLVKWLANRNAADRTSVYESHVHYNSRFGARATGYTDVPHEAFFGYSSESLELLRHERRNGVRTTVCQVDPGQFEDDIVAEEEKRFPNFLSAAGPARRSKPEAFQTRLHEEWSEAHTVVVNSRWSAEALVLQGVPEHKIKVVPLMYDAPPVRVSREPSLPLRVLWLGTLCLRKGLPYALEAAQMLKASPVRFTFAGALDVNPLALNLPDNCRYIGHVSRSLLPDVYGEHDVLLLPTLSDGFALTQLEAMAHGLPVIATANCGDVVEEGRSGFLVPVRDSKALVRAIGALLENPEHLESMSVNAQARAKEFSSRAVWPILNAALSGPAVPADFLSSAALSSCERAI
jgi:glycosyltransferase involved in cell wall biosynthesis